MITIIEGLLGADEVAQFREHMDAATWQDGVHTAGGSARAAKDNLQLADGAEPALGLGQHILKRLGNHPLFISAALPRKILPPRFNRYAGGGAYGTHIDSALMRSGADTIRTDLSATIFLSSPDDYDGGVLEIETSTGAQPIKLDAGDMVLYLANSLHRVTPVTRGARVASFFWVESLVRDDGERALLFELDQSIQQLTRQIGDGDNAELLRLTALYHNLLRRWTIT